MKTMHCNFNPDDHKYYCSTKTKYGMFHPKECELILDHNELFNYIKENPEKFKYCLPILISQDFKRKKLELEGREI